MTNRSDDTEILAKFHDWLTTVHVELDLLGDDSLPRGPETREIGLYQLVEEFTALRHELKLQTKSTRSLQEAAESTVAALSQASEQFRAVEPKEAQAAWSAGKSLAEALADLDEALERGRGEIERARRRIVEDSTRAIENALRELYLRRPWPLRQLLKGYHHQALEAFRVHGREVRHELFGALLEGYGLIQNRLQRSLKAEQIHRTVCVGKPVDPELMTVIEVVDDPDRPAGQVVEEVRRGYTWRGRVLRFAEVKAARNPEFQ